MEKKNVPIWAKIICCIVLIAVLVSGIIMGINVRNKGKSDSTEKQQSETNQKELFNSNYESFAGEDVLGASVEYMLEIVEMYNDEDNMERYVYVALEDNIEKTEDLVGKIDLSGKYKVKMQYDTQGYVKQINVWKNP